MERNHELFSFFKSISTTLALEYERISARSKEDPGTAGDEVEENWKQLLEHWLPPNYRVVTKGRLLSSNGEASPQIDIIVLKPSYPPFLIDKKYYLIGGVAAAFECKTTLRPRDLEKAFETAATIARLCKKKTGNPCIELLPPVPYGVLAHSHSWKGEEEDVVNQLSEKIKELGKKYAQHPRELLENICIANLAGWTTGHATYIFSALSDAQIPSFEEKKEVFNIIKSRNPGFSSRVVRQENGLDVLFIYRAYSVYFTQYIKKPREGIKTETLREKYTPIGAFVYSLYKKLSYRDSSVTSISDYLSDVHIPGGSGGLGPENGIMWENNVFSESVQRKISQGIREHNGDWRDMYF
ncbi:TPA: DUF6602 domain-containing protein [Serratia marcescens]